MPYLTLRDAKIYYEVQGQGPVIIFAHGLAGNHLSWWQQVPAFRDQYRCVTFAFRGFYPSIGEPDPARHTDDLSALIDQLHLKPVILVGQSMGTFACSDYVLRYPERVRALIMTSGLGVVTVPDLEPGNDQWPDVRRRGIHPAAGERMALEQPALHYLYQLIDGLTPNLDKEAVVPRLFAERNKDPRLLADSPVPTLFIFGREDRTDAELEWVRASFPGRRVEVVEDAGHSVYFERPSDYNRLVTQFLDSLNDSGA